MILECILIYVVRREFRGIRRTPQVMMKMMSNTRTASTVLRSERTSIGQARRGRVMKKKILIGPTPSTRAAS